ncbi:hypothetical protein SAMN05518848_12018 [Paenibacillus sp. PDC88]|nr:hypothetical protein SAMN05518848_12018 [Paenibacillus sp. PDC88]
MESTMYTYMFTFTFAYIVRLYSSCAAGAAKGFLFHHNLMCRFPFRFRPC